MKEEYVASSYTSSQYAKTYFATIFDDYSISRQSHMHVIHQVYQNTHRTKR